MELNPMANSRDKCTLQMYNSSYVYIMEIYSERQAVVIMVTMTTLSEMQYMYTHRSVSRMKNTRAVCPTSMMVTMTTPPREQ